MKEFYNDFGFIIAFLIMVLIIGVIGGEKVTKWFLYLVLFSMIILNADKAIELLKGAFTLNESSSSTTSDPLRSTTHTSQSGQTHGGGSRGF